MGKANLQRTLGAHHPEPCPDLPLKVLLIDSRSLLEFSEKRGGRDSQSRAKNLQKNVLGTIAKKTIKQVQKKSVTRKTRTIGVPLLRLLLRSSWLRSSWKVIGFETS